MIIETSVELQPGLFTTLHPVDLDTPYYFIVNRVLPINTRIAVEPFPKASRVQTMFSILQVGLHEQVSQGAPQVGYALHSAYPTRNLIKSALAYSLAQVEGLTPELEAQYQSEAGLVLRTDLFFVYHLPNMATLASNAALRERTHDALTSLV